MLTLLHKSTALLASKRKLDEKQVNRHHPRHCGAFFFIPQPLAVIIQHLRDTTTSCIYFCHLPGNSSALKHSGTQLWESKIPRLPMWKKQTLKKTGRRKGEQSPTLFFLNTKCDAKSGVSVVPNDHNHMAEFRPDPHAVLTWMNAHTSVCVCVRWRLSDLKEWKWSKETFCSVTCPHSCD